MKYIGKYFSTVLRLTHFCTFDTLLYFTML